VVEAERRPGHCEAEQRAVTMSSMYAGDLLSVRRQQFVEAVVGFPHRLLWNKSTEQDFTISLKDITSYPP